MGLGYNTTLSCIYIRLVIEGKNVKICAIFKMLRRNLQKVVKMWYSIGVADYCGLILFFQKAVALRHVLLRRYWVVYKKIICGDATGIFLTSLFYFYCFGGLYVSCAYHPVGWQDCFLLPFIMFFKFICAWLICRWHLSKNE